MPRVPDDPMGELLACLDVLRAYVEETPNDPVFTESEFFTAVWQTVELVEWLIGEHHEALNLMDRLLMVTAPIRDGAARAQEATKLVIASAGDEKRLLRDRGIGGQRS